MRQLRVQTRHSCPMTSSCQHDYSFIHEDKRSFQPGWTLINLNMSNYTSSIRRAYQYRSDNELDTYVIIGKHHTYASGGYVYEFRGRLNELRTNLSQLHQLNWIDSRTRAIIIQMNIYNPNANLFGSLSLLTEFLSTGGVDTQLRIEPFRFQCN
jgi:hypothetical protein